MDLRNRVSNLAQLNQGERLGRQQSMVHVGLWAMIVANLVFTAAYGWQFAPPAEAGFWARVFSLVVHTLFIDVATMIWMVAIVAADSDRQRALAWWMHHAGLVLSTVASVVFAYLAFGGDLIPAGRMIWIQGVGFYTMLIAAGAQFLSAYLYHQWSPENKMAQNRATVRRLQKENMVTFQADLALETENEREELLAPYRPALVAQEARRQTEEALKLMGYSDELVERLLPTLLDKHRVESAAKLRPPVGPRVPPPVPVVREGLEEIRPSVNGHHEREEARPL